MVLLGVNIDHVATVRNARGGAEPDPVTAARLAEAHGADGITAHLREDRRHIRDADIDRLKAEITTRLNLEMAATPEMLEIALRVKPDMVTLVPERREERTTEGGLDVAGQHEAMRWYVGQLRDADIPVSLFVDPDSRQLEACATAGAPIVELHTGDYANSFGRDAALHQRCFQALEAAARQCIELNLHLNAGHGLTYENVRPVAALPNIVELNIGHNIIAQSIFTGLGPAVAEMKRLLQ